MWHPDKNAHTVELASRKFNEVKIALDILSDEDGVWRCRTTFNCVEACPRGINITKAILEVSSAISSRE